MTGRATAGSAFARSARNGLSTAAAELAVMGGIDALPLVRRTYAASMRRGGVRRALHKHGRDHQLDKAHSAAYAHSSALAVVCEQMGRLAKAGATLEELLRFAEALYEHAMELTGRTLRSLDALDTEEAMLNADEDVKQLRRRIHGETPQALVHEAELRARLGSLNTEFAIVLRRRAARLDRPLAVA